MTNADKIRRMTDEELSKILSKTDGFGKCLFCDRRGVECPFGCEKGILQWLKDEVSE